MIYSLRIKTFSWDKHQYELFDNESNTYVQNTYNLQGNGYLFRTNNENETHHHRGFEQIKTLQNEDGDQFKVMMAFSEMNNFYLIGSPKQHRIQDQDDLWIQVPRSQTIGQSLYQLKEKDIFKVGKKQFKIVQMNFENEAETLVLQKPQSHYESFASMMDSQCDSMISNDNSPSKDNKRMCRICLGQSHNETNPLVSLCKCSGTMKFSHYECIKTWLDGKQEIKLHPPFCLEYAHIFIKKRIKAKSVRCELCYQFYPPQFSYSSVLYTLYLIEGLKLRNYMVLEDLEGYLLIVNFYDQVQLILGRGHSSQIKISEITVSREHVSFTLKDKKVYVQDLESKFGTLVKIQTLKTITVGDNLNLQSGRTKIQIKVHRNTKPLLTLCGNAILCPFQQDRDDRDIQFQSKK